MKRPLEPPSFSPRSSDITLDMQLAYGEQAPKPLHSARELAAFTLSHPRNYLLNVLILVDAGNQLDSPDAAQRAAPGRMRNGLPALGPSSRRFQPPEPQGPGGPGSPVGGCPRDGQATSAPGDASRLSRRCEPSSPDRLAAAAAAPSRLKEAVL